MDWNKIDWNNIKCEIINGDFSLGTYVTVKINGEEYTRKVFDCKEDLYIRIHGYKFYFSDFYTIKGE